MTDHVYKTGAYLYAPVKTTINWTRTQAFRAFMNTHPDQKNIKYPKLTGVVPTSQWGTTFHRSTEADPVWRAKLGANRLTAILTTQGVHVADTVFRRIPTGTQDRPFLIVDQVFGYTAFFADVVPDYVNRTFTASAGNVFWHGSNGLDARNPLGDDPRNFCSRGRIPDSLCIPADEIKAAAAAGGDLGRVLQMFFVETNSADGYRHPMVGAESGKHGWGAEGERLAIRPDLDLASAGLGLRGEALALARTLQRYGVYNGDNSGSSSTLKGEQCSTLYQPYKGTTITPNCLQPVPWSDWVVVT